MRYYFTKKWKNNSLYWIYLLNKKKLLYLLSEKELDKLPYKEIEEYCSKIIKELVKSEKEVRENEKY